MTPDMKAALDKLEPEMRRAFEEAIAKITSQVQVRLLEEAIAEGNFQKAFALINADPAFFGKIDMLVREAQWQAGVMILAGLGALKDPFLVGAWLSVLMGDTPAPKHGPARGQAS